MGASPVAAFLSLGLPRELTARASRRPPWVQRFLDGLLALAAVHKTPLAGGDLSESPVAIADIILIGRFPRGKALLRSGARPGHLLYVTGSLGGSAAALVHLAQLAAANAGVEPPRIPKNLQALLAPQLYPQPHVAQGLFLQRRGLASAAIDLSDGLSTDLAHLCQESAVAAEVEAALLPIHPAATLAQALNGGEDYELLFAAPASARIPRTIAGVPITRIGRILPRRSGPPVTLITTQGREPLTPAGWQHFS
jgi:thiamine-monophosphate kinase